MRSVRFFTQLFWLEDSNDPQAFWKIARYQNFLDPVENLRITIRRSDWWNWESNAALNINPFRRRETDEVMRRDMASDSPRFRGDDVWGLAFQYLPKLKGLQIDFETAEDKKGELETIVDWAVKWKFPLSGGRYLSTAGQRVERMSWRGRSYHWARDGCPDCSARRLHGMADCATCNERTRYDVHGYGPRLYVWTLTWKPVVGVPTADASELA